MGLRVLFLARHLDSGGVTTHMMTLAQGLRDRGCEVAVASSGLAQNHSHGPKWFEANGIRHFLIHFPGPFMTIANAHHAIQALGELNNVVRHGFRPDLIHVHYRSTSPYAEVIRRLYGIPFVTTLHLDQIPSGAIYRVGSFWGERAIAISSETRQYLIQAFHVPPSRIRLVYNGVDEGHFRPPTDQERRAARKELGLGPEDKVVSLIGRIELTQGGLLVKGHDVLIRALARLRDSGVDAKAVFAGSGNQADNVRVLAEEAGVADCILMPGYVDSRKVLWASDVCALPSRQEGFALVVVEAMLTGVVPVRTPAAGATDQIEQGVNGFIIPFDDDAALAARLGQLFTDEALRTTMAQAALRTARKRFGMSRMVDETLSVYGEALNRSGSEGVAQARPH